MRMRICILVGLLATAIAAGPASAKNLFVATTGNDSVTWDTNDISRPWLTAATAWCSARAGDTVYFRGGTYPISGTIDTRLCGNNGTREAPITFTRYGTEAVTLSGGSVLTVINIEKSWNVIRGLTSVGGGSFYKFGANNTIEGGLVEDCTHTMSVGGDNVGFVFIGAHVSNVTVNNCTVKGPGVAVHGNTACIIAFASPGLKIQNCNLSNAPIGIYYKHSNALIDSGITFRNNYIHGCTIGMRTVANYARIENNLLVGCPIELGNDGGVGQGYVGADYNTILHNTTWGSRLIMLYQTRDTDPNKGCLHNTIQDNVFMQECSFHEYIALNADIRTDYNLYPAGNVVRQNRISYTLASWRTQNRTDARSLSGAPTFTGGVSPASISGYALGPESPGKMAASDGKDIGADVALVGVKGQVIIPPAPPPPAAPPPPPPNAAPATPTLESVQAGVQNFGAATIYHDEFEDALTLGQKYGDYNSAGGSCTISTAKGYGGTSRSVIGHWNTGQTDAGSFGYFFGRSPSVSQAHSTTDFREVYWRMYILTSKGWSGNPEKLTRATIIAAPNWAQAMIAHVWGAPGDLLLEIDPASGINASGALVTTTYNDFPKLTWLGLRKGTTPVYDSAHSGTWQCVEAHVKLNTPGNSDGVFELWVDGNLEARRTDLNWVGTWQAYGINAVMFENYSNAGAPRAQDRYIDNIVISRQPIGFATAPLTPRVYKSVFEDRDAGDVQSAMEAQVSSTADVAGLVWDGLASGAGDSLQVGAAGGVFQGALAGRSALAPATKYFVRVRQLDRVGLASLWSSWKPFLTEAVVSGDTTPPAIPRQFRTVP